MAKPKPPQLVQTKPGENPPGAQKSGQSVQGNQVDTPEEILKLKTALEEERNRRAGLDRVLTEQKKAIDEVNKRLQQYEGLFGALKQTLGVEEETDEEDKFNSIYERVEGIERQLQEERKKAQQAQNEARKLGLLTKVNPKLAKFADYIPSVEDEVKQMELISNFMATLKEVVPEVTDLNAKQPPPATPPATNPPSGTKNTKTLVQLNKELIDAILRNDDPKEIEKLRSRYYDALDRSA